MVQKFLINAIYIPKMYRKECLKHQRCMSINKIKTEITIQIPKINKAKPSSKDTRFHCICSLASNKTKSSTTFSHLDQSTQPQTLENWLFNVNQLIKWDSKHRPLDQT